VVFDCFWSERSVPVFFKMKREEQVGSGGLLVFHSSLDLFGFSFLCIKIALENYLEGNIYTKKALSKKLVQ
jgi:hypothetical protein